MQTSSSTDDAEDLPIPCTISIQEQDGPIDGTVWAFYPHRCLVESHQPLTAGMTVSLTLHLSEIARVRLGVGIVTWARGQECGIEFTQSSASTTFERMSFGAEEPSGDQAREGVVERSSVVSVNQS